MAEVWLLADIGATNTRIGLASDGKFAPQTAQNLSNANFENPTALIRAYLAREEPNAIAAICAGVAGPVEGNFAKLTNLDWVIDGTALAGATGADHVLLINDLQAQAFALPDLSDTQTRCLISGATADTTATRLVLGLGTGCNIAVAYPTQNGVYVPPSETGHTRLPALPEIAPALVTHLQKTATHLPIESVLSGPGFLNLAHFCGSVADTTQSVLQAQSEPANAEAIRIYLRVLGTVLGDIALSHLPMGGIYLIGGFARAIAPLIKSPDFIGSFTDKGPYRTIMEAIPLHIITDDKAALYGCARALRQQT